MRCCREKKRGKSVVGYRMGSGHGWGVLRVVMWRYEQRCGEVQEVGGCGWLANWDLKAGLQLGSALAAWALGVGQTSGRRPAGVPLPLQEGLQHVAAAQRCWQGWLANQPHPAHRKGSTANGVLRKKESFARRLSVGRGCSGPLPTHRAAHTPRFAHSLLCLGFKPNVLGRYWPASGRENHLDSSKNELVIFPQKTSRTLQDGPPGTRGN